MIGCLGKRSTGDASDEISSDSHQNGYRVLHQNGYRVTRKQQASEQTDQLTNRKRDHRKQVSQFVFDRP